MNQSLLSTTGDHAWVIELPDTSFPTANAAVKALEELNIANETTGQRTNRQYSYASYIEALAY